jgi:hypothetical protein
MQGACTSDPTDPNEGGQVPEAAPSCGNDITYNTRYTPCCALAFGGGCDVNGWSQLKTCAEREGDLVFDVYSPRGCADKQSGLSNNLEPYGWCRDGNGAQSGTCWLPYSMNEAGDCFPYDVQGSGQWLPDADEPEWMATVQKGSPSSIETIILTGAGPLNDANMVRSGSVHTVHGGNVAGVTVGAAACLAIFNRKRIMKTVPKSTAAGNRPTKSRSIINRSPCPPSVLCIELHP